MKLYDVLDLITEYTNVAIINLEGEYKAFYDGKDSIPELYNYFKVIAIETRRIKYKSEYPKSFIVIRIDF